MNNTLVRQQREFILLKRLFEWKLWFRWISANLIGETIGLGIIGIAEGISVLWLVNNFNSSSAVVIALLIIALGTFKGAFIGFLQGRVLRKALPNLNLQNWTAATIIGTVAALILAILPGFLTLFAEDARYAHTIKITEISMSVSTTVMGLGLGIILGFPQWFVLRRYVNQAGWWIFANALAWAVGLPLLFAAPGVIHLELPFWRIVLIIFAPVVSAAAAVGAIHGLFLIWLLKSKENEN